MCSRSSDRCSSRSDQAAAQLVEPDFDARDLEPNGVPTGLRWEDLLTGGHAQHVLLRDHLEGRSGPDIHFDAIILEVVQLDRWDAIEFECLQRSPTMVTIEDATRVTVHEDGFVVVSLRS